jgi:glucose/arabinose dehydrogenase
MRISTSLAAVAAALAFAAQAGAPPAKISVPSGFRATIFARGLEHPTAMAWGPDRRLYVTEDTGLVVATERGSTMPVVVASGLRVPLGLAWRGRTLFVSDQGRLLRYSLRHSKLGGGRTLVRKLPFGLHQQDNVVVGPDGRLYLGSGSTCDVCKERDPRSATILSMKPDGSDVRVVARGLRNRSASPSSPARPSFMPRSTARTSWGRRGGPSRRRWSCA